MSPTATKTTPSAELARLEQKRETTHAEVQKIKRARNTHDDETQRLRAEMGARQSSHRRFASSADASAASSSCERDSRAFTCLRGTMRVSPTRAEE